MKQTAVEWLFEQIINRTDRMYFLKEFEQAKEMEKDQHSKTWDTALDKYKVRAGNHIRAYEDFDEYYNETFKPE